MNDSAIPSPCTGICKLDAATGWCLGCARTGAEMDHWRSKPEAIRAAIWSEIPNRLTQLGVTCRRLPWTTEQIRSFVSGSLQHNTGSWIMGVVGAVAQFSVASGRTVQTSVSGDIVTAQTERAALRMRIDDGVRALTFEPPETPLDRARIVLAVKRERGRLPVRAGIEDLGDDDSALLSDDAGRLVDLGLGRKEARFSVRVPEGPTYAQLTAWRGVPLLDALPDLGPDLVADSPTRVVDTALGRIEVAGPIPHLSDAVSVGSRTHLSPDLLATGRALPVGMDLPRAYLPGAIFHPLG